MLASEVPPDELAKYSTVRKTFRVQSKDYSVDGHFDLVQGQRSRGSASWWEGFTVVKVKYADPKSKEQWLETRIQCNKCNMYLTASNP